MNLFAGTEFDLRFDAEAKRFKPSADVAEGAVFRCRVLTYWETDEVMTQPNDREKVRKLIELALVAIDGDADQAKQFCVKPKAKLVNPLFEAVWAECWGN